ncbi:MAG: 3-phosphoshikimate 1-carboxyvinyltransferase [Alphaproteobacteria bacterium]|nr:3-phosphoshikimate 1-carboxyvinyltransferase [Alphaproteobacteria bacterium]
MQMKYISSKAKTGLKGDKVTVPGDKSMSHRALMIGSMAIGKTTAVGLLAGEDVISTSNAMQALGAVIDRDQQEVKLGIRSYAEKWSITGRGVGGLMEPADVLDMGNAGTGVRLLMGILASHNFPTFLTGDGSLRKRPMNRVINPLLEMGARFTSRSGGRLPLMVEGTDTPMPLIYELPVASAQVKSAILFAGLNTAGKTTVVEPNPTRDHTETMLRKFGADVVVDELPNGGRAITLTGHPELKACDLQIPDDWSSAAFPAVAALLVDDSDIRILDVGINPLRFGLFETLQEMGADITIENVRENDGEPIADIRVKSSMGNLKGIDVPAERAPSMIDEYPILAVLASCAEGITRMFGLEELRVKESDRLEGVAEGLKACGVNVEVEDDTLIVHGSGKPPKGGAEVKTSLDHRMAMSFLVLGMVSDEPVSVDDGSPIATSFPSFVELMNGLGADLTVGD